MSVLCYLDMAEWKQLTVRLSPAALQQLEAYARELSRGGLRIGVAQAARVAIYQHLASTGHPVPEEGEDAEEPAPAKPSKRKH
jgi:hypothetical protein